MMCACRSRLSMLFGAVALAALCLNVGCGGPKGPPGSICVTGSVLYDGKSLPEAVVHFAPKEQATAGSGGAARLKGTARRRRR